MLPKARIPDPGPKALESIRLSVFVPGGKTAGHHPTSGWHDLEDHGGGTGILSRGLHGGVPPLDLVVDHEDEEPAQANGLGMRGQGYTRQVSMSLYLAGVPRPLIHWFLPRVSTAVYGN